MTARLRWRKLLSGFMLTMTGVCAVVAVSALFFILGYLVYHGGKSISWSFFTKLPAPVGETGGGMANAIVGSAKLLLLATLFGVPVGFFGAIYLAEFSQSTIAFVVRYAADLLNGVPSIVIGIFAYGLLVAGSGQAAWKASFALGVIMLPIVSRTTIEILALVPDSLREASFALGVAKWRTVLFVILPTVRGGVLTGSTLAVARAAGETAPLLFTTSIFLNAVVSDPRQAMDTLPYTIFTYSEAADPNLNRQAWAAAFILMAFVLVTSLSARFLLSRSERRLRGR